MSAFRSVPALRSVGPSRAQRQSVRYAHDLIIQHRPDAKQTPQPVIKKGPPTGGRSAVSGHTVTVFGCTGFLGRYLVSKLGRAGTQVIVPYRDEDSKRHLKIMGDLGQIVPLEWDARNPDQIYECVKHSDTVYNLTGRDWETRNFKYEDVNVKAAKLIAEVSAAANVPRLVHVSHMNAAADSPSDLYRTKWEGERAVRDAFPEATIVRPARMFGPEDGFLSDIARWPFKYKLNGGETRIMPVHVMDVAEALNVILTAPVTSTASTFVLPGPEAYSFNELINLVEFFTLKKLGSAMTIPRPVIEFAAQILNRAIWWPTISPDEIRRMYMDDLGVSSHLSRPDPTIPSGWGGEAIPSPFLGVDGEAVKGFADLGISPDLVEEHAQKYLRRFRNASSYDTPLETGHFKPTKRYHTIP